MSTENDSPAVAEGTESETWRGSVGGERWGVEAVPGISAISLTIGSGPVVRMFDAEGRREARALAAALIAAVHATDPPGAPMPHLFPGEPDGLWP